MSRAPMLRPSLFVAGWTFVLVGVFVWRGELRVDLAPGSTMPAPVTAPEPRVARVPSARATKVATVSRQGRVFDALGFLVVGAEIVPMDRTPMRTDGDGQFAVELAPGGVADLLVRADGHGAAWVRVSEASPDALAVQLGPAAPWDAPPPAFEPLPRLRGEGIVRRDDGRPLAHAFVTALGTGVWARSDDIGRFVVPLPTPSTSLFVHDPDGGFAGVSPAIVNQRAQGAVPLADVVAAPALAIRGIVRDARGEPVDGLPVAIAGAHARRIVDTGSGGAFRIGGLLPGSYSVAPFSSRGAVGVEREVTLASASLELDLQLLATEETRVRVVDEHGAPVPGVYVATNVGGARRGVAQADTDGFAAVPVATQTGFDVRRPQTFAPVTVRRFEVEPAATLVVAMP